MSIQNACSFPTDRLSGWLRVLSFVWKTVLRGRVLVAQLVMHGSAAHCGRMYTFPCALNYVT